MPDLTIEHSSICETNVSWRYEVPGGKYLVTREHTPWGETLYGFTCTCPAFKFKHKECKHIIAADKFCCQWNSECETGPAPEDNLCPTCKGPLKTIRVAV